MHNIDSREKAEELREPAQLRLFFFRHDEKGSNPENTDEGDYRVSLTEKGRVNAASVGMVKTHATKPALLFGSPRDRSLMTAIIHAYPEMAQYATLKEMKAKMRELLGIQLAAPEQPPRHNVQNWMQTEHLNFAFGAQGGPMRKLYDQHYLQEKDLLHYVWKQSDKDLAASGDTTAFSYSIYAGNIAKEILRATKVLQNMVRHDTKRAGVLQHRFYGSHQSVTECLILKVLEKTQGHGAAQKFLDSLEGKQGFNFSEGFEVDVIHGGDLPTYRLKTRNLELSFDSALLQQIIAEGDALQTNLEK